MVNRIVFVHGWSIHHTGTYGELPERLRREIPGLDIHHLHLAKYISFKDEVRMNDLANAMEAAIRTELKPDDVFAVIAHSTGGPLVRTWWQRHYLDTGKRCPMTHAIYLAAAHFGSALAQLGKDTLGRIKSFFEAIEPGVGILNWLELGSPEAWTLNEKWIRLEETFKWPTPVFQFCLVGQAIDRKLYDNLNSYTGEMGSDGTVRAAAANLTASYVRLLQQAPTSAQIKNGKPSPIVFDSQRIVRSQEVAFCLIPATSHSGLQMGIMRSVKAAGARPAVVDRIMECLAVTSAEEYAAVVKRFASETDAVVQAELVEFEDKILIDRTFLHDRCSMVVIRVRDEEGSIPDDMRIIFSGENNDPNKLPQGFLIDRQANKRDKGTITFFFDYDVMNGSPARYLELPGKRRKKVRDAIEPLSGLGLRIEAFPDSGFAHYHPCEAKASPELLHEFLTPHQTTLIEIVLRRIVHKGAFQFAPDLTREEFRDATPGDVL